MKRQIQFKKKLYNLLENDSNYSTPRAIFDIILAIVILTSIILFFIESKNGELSPLLLEVDLVITVFFIIEFLLRGYVCSNFREDWKKNGAAYAIYQKVDWLKRPMTVVDFLAILPGIKAFRVFKS
ncbi:ion transporter, partial [Ornithobacterium rhinotracheale]